MLKRICAERRGEKEIILPPYVFLPPWHHYCIVTDFGHTEAVWLTLGLGVMHPGTTREEKKQHIGAQGTGALTDEGLGCGWALKNVRGFCDETRQTLGIF